MGKITGFLEFSRIDQPHLEIAERVTNWREFYLPYSEETLREQGARCMDCGVPFCHQGCPVNNLIPDWNDLVYRGDWQAAVRSLHSTNNFPDFTGRICPAPCEAACVLTINDDPVTIKSIELAIVERGFAEGWLKPEPAARQTGKRVAVVGSGPAGLACAQQLARAGHRVVLFEKADRIGGLLRYGIPDFKLEKRVIDRRMEQLAAEGVAFRPNTHVGVDYPVARLLSEHDAVVLTGGTEQPRDLSVPGRELAGVHFAMDFLTQQNHRTAGDEIAAAPILAKDRHVVVIGGGDTGSDCVGTARRQGAASITQFEILERPPFQEDKGLTWPDWPLKLRTSTSQEEGCERDWSILTKRLGDDGLGHAKTLHAIRLEWRKEAGAPQRMVEVPGSDFTLKADLVLLAMGFVHPPKAGLLETLEVELEPRGHVKADTQTYRTSLPKVFAAGDMRRGQSLVVWAIREGRQAARAVDEFLMGASELPR